MPQRSLIELRPQKFPRIGDEENAFNSYDEDTEDDQLEESVVSLAQSNETDDTPLLDDTHRRNLSRCFIQ